MEALVRDVLERLRRREPARDALRALGDPDPDGAAAALLETAQHPDLAPHTPLWLPRLLASARPGFGASALEQLASRSREAGAPLEPARAPALAGVLGNSNFLARLLLRRPDWTRELHGAPPAAPEPREPEPDWTQIRLAKYRGLLRVVGRDLMGRPVHESLDELSQLADRCLRAALRCALAEHPGPGVEGTALLALGKLGGHELNFSSDVDLLFLYERDPGPSDPARNDAVSRLVRALKTRLEEPTSDGFAYRVDLDLRPEGRSGALANSVHAALSYYESFGEEWERQMLIRLRPVAGSAAAAEQFVREVTPFVFRRSIDPGAMRAVRTMKLRIEEERRRAGRDLEADLKEGPGGIRDVEFLVQSLQLFHGGQQPELRGGNVLQALAALGRHRLLPESVAGALGEAYTWLRRAEHALQLVEEQQTAAFPRDPSAQRALARRLGYDDAEGERARSRLLDDWTAARNEVRGHFDALVLREKEA